MTPLDCCKRITKSYHHQGKEVEQLMKALKDMIVNGGSIDDDFQSNIKRSKEQRHNSSSATSSLTSEVTFEATSKGVSFCL